MDKIYTALPDRSQRADQQPEKGTIFCFEESCKDQIKEEKVFPDTMFWVDIDTITEATDDFELEKCFNKKIHNCPARLQLKEGSKTAENPTYCAPGVPCRVFGILSCIGVFVITEDQGLIAFHYVSGDDEHEAYKLTDTLKLMKEHEFKNAKLEFYLNKDKLSAREEEYRKNSMIIIETTLQMYPTIHEGDYYSIEITAP